jgi:Protein of unknown function (DUF2000)
MNEQKCVIVVDNTLPSGIIANAAACLGFSLGAVLPHELGPVQVDADGVAHGGIINIPIPILSATSDQVKSITDSAKNITGLVVYDMSDAAQSSKTQDEYRQKLERIANVDLRYWAVALYGDKKAVNKLCGSLPLFRG